MANVNTGMTFNQASTVLNSIVKQATGQEAIAPTTTAEFVSVAQKALRMGYDPLLNAVSQVLSRTIFSVRPYSANFRGLMRDSVAWGNHVRKIKFGPHTVEDDDRRGLVDGQSLDQQIVKKPSVIQTNFYSFNTYQMHYTIFRDQLDVAFQSADEFARFVSGCMTEVSNSLESYREEFARSTLNNFIAGKIDLGGDGVRHLITEFATEFGITPATYDEVITNHFDAFIKWLYAELKILSGRMEKRTDSYQANITGFTLLQHTPKARQRLYLYQPILARAETTVLSAAFHDNYLGVGDHESVTFWQAFDNPDSISITPSVINATGEYAQGDAVTQSHVLGILMDYEAAGITQMNEWANPAPFNARGGYTTTWYHMDMRGWNDFTEKAVVLLLD